MFAKTFAAALAAALILMPAGSAQAQDAMSTDNMMADGMAMDAMAPMMSDADLTLCLDQAGAISFPEVAMAAEQACHDLHDGHGSMMAGDAMAPQ